MLIFTTTDSDHTGADAAKAPCNRIMGFHVTSGVAASVVLLRNGSATGEIFIAIKTPAAGSTHFSANRPIPFPKGLFIDTDANVERGTVVPG